MTETRIRTTCLGFPTTLQQHTCVIQATNDFTDIKCARHGQFQEKKTRSAVEIRFFPGNDTQKSLIEQATNTLY